MYISLFAMYGLQCLLSDFLPEAGLGNKQEHLASNMNLLTNVLDHENFLKLYNINMNINGSLMCVAHAIGYFYSNYCLCTS